MGGRGWPASQPCRICAALVRAGRLSPTIAFQSGSSLRWRSSARLWSPAWTAFQSSTQARGAAVRIAAI